MLHLKITVPKDTKAVRSHIVSHLGTYYIHNHFDTHFIEDPDSQVIVECKDKGVGPVRLSTWTDVARGAFKRALRDSGEL
jgi:hypothetical protein